MSRIILFTIAIITNLATADAAATAASSSNPFAVNDDESGGFIVWCHCMGRFGNQIDVFLGGLRIAKELNRTLIVPPFVEYNGYKRRYVPYKEFFNMTILADYHRVVDMEDFFGQYGEDMSWKRVAFCVDYGQKEDECQMRRGQPSTDFWDLYDIQFNASVRFKPHEMLQPNIFKELYPQSIYPVVMLRDCPGRFPVLATDRELQRFVVFRDDLLENVTDTVLDALPKPTLSVHIRNGIDWKQACDHAVGRKSFMESPQCLDPNGDSTINENMCFPNMEYTIRRIRHVVIKTNSKSVYIGTDNNAWVKELRHELDRYGQNHVIIKTSPFKTNNDAYMKDLVVFSNTEFFLGNCISSFTGFAARYRQHVNDDLETLFFGIDDDDYDDDDVVVQNTDELLSKQVHDERNAVEDKFGYRWHDYYDPTNKPTKACYILPSADRSVSKTTLEETEDNFFNRCDYGLVNTMRNEMKYEFNHQGGGGSSNQDDDKLTSSSLMCTMENAELCHGKNVIVAFPEKIERGRRSNWSEQKDLIRPILDESTCDVSVTRPTILLKPDSHANFYHAMCDFANLYLSMHVLDKIDFANGENRTDQELTTLADVVLWVDRPHFHTKFGPLYHAFTGKDSILKTAKEYAGKNVCFTELVLSVNPRGSINNFFYNMYVPGRMQPLDMTKARGTYDITCSGSNIFMDFLHFINHKNPTLINKSAEYMTKSDRPLIIRMLSRSSGRGATSGTRKLLNENDVLMAVREKYSEEQVNISIVDFDWSQGRTIDDQYHTFQKCDILFGMHGAGLANMLFLPPWGSVIEVYNCDDDWCYSDLSRLSGFGYSRATEADVKRFKPEVNVKETHREHKKYFNYEIDIDVAVRLIEDAMKTVIRHKDSPFDMNSQEMQDLLLRLSKENSPLDHSNRLKPYQLHDEM